MSGPLIPMFNFNRDYIPGQGMDTQARVLIAAKLLEGFTLDQMAREARQLRYEASDRDEMTEWDFFQTIVEQIDVCRASRSYARDNYRFHAS